MSAKQRFVTAPAVVGEEEPVRSLRWWGWVLVAAGVGLVVVVAVLALKGSTESGTEDLNAALAEHLRVPVRELYVNLPPMAKRYPSTLFFDRFGIVDHFTEADDPELTRGPESDFHHAADVQGKVSGSIAVAVFKSIASANQNLQIDVVIPDLRGVELERAKLKTRLEKHLGAGVAAPPDLNVIIRSFEGHIEYRITKKVGASSAAWVEFTKGVKEGAKAHPEVSVRMDSEVERAKEVTVSTKEPVVIAYVACRATDLATAASGTMPTPVPAQLFQKDVSGAVTRVLKGKADPKALDLALQEAGDPAEVKAALEDVVNKRAPTDPVRMRADVVLKERVGRFDVHHHIR